MTDTPKRGPGRPRGGKGRDPQFTIRVPVTMKAGLAGVPTDAIRAKLAELLG